MVHDLLVQVLDQVVQDLDQVVIVQLVQDQVVVLHLPEHLQVEGVEEVGEQGAAYYLLIVLILVLFEDKNDQVKK